jgi:hypothetical protein
MKFPDKPGTPGTVEKGKLAEALPNRTLLPNRNLFCPTIP